MRSLTAVPHTPDLRLTAVVFDWAGTIVDHGSCAPVEAFCELFRRRGVDISTREARTPMGREKRAHIAALLAMPRISSLWREVCSHAATDAEIDSLYEEFEPVQRELLASHADPIPGVLEMLAVCRQLGLKIGSSSGYAASLMERLVALAREREVVVDAVVSATEVPAGRPAPWMVFQNMQLLGVYPPATVVTVDDTTVGIEAGLNAGTWTVGVVETGNVLGLSQLELEKLDPSDRQERFAAGREEMLRAGAHYALRSVADMAPVLENLAGRLQRGERP